MSTDYWMDSPQRAFDRMVGPTLTNMEQSRLLALETSGKRLRLGGPAGIAAVVALGWYSWNSEHFLTFVLLAAVFLGVLLAIWVNAPKKAFEAEQRSSVLDAVCQHVGDLRYSYEVANRDFPMEDFRTAKIVPSYTSYDLEDLLDGEYRGCRFGVVEAKLRRKSGKHTKTVFKGLLIRISLPRAAEAPVTIARNNEGWGKLGKSLVDWFMPGDPVEIPHPEFEARFDVYCKNANVALSLVTPAFVENFLALPEVLGSEKILAAFSEDMFLLSTDGTAPFLESFSANTPTSELSKSFERVVEEVKIIHRVIDQLLEGDRYAQRA